VLLLNLLVISAAHVSTQLSAPNSEHHANRTSSSVECSGRSGSGRQMFGMAPACAATQAALLIRPQVGLLHWHALVSSAQPSATVRSAQGTARAPAMQITAVHLQWAHSQHAGVVMQGSVLGPSNLTARSRCAARVKQQQCDMSTADRNSDTHRRVHSAFAAAAAAGKRARSQEHQQRCSAAEITACRESRR